MKTIVDFVVSIANRVLAGFERLVIWGAAPATRGKLRDVGIV